MSNEIILDVKDLLYKVLVRWRSILVALLIGMITLNLVGIMRSYKASSANGENNIVSVVAEKKAALNKNEAENTEQAYKNYLSLMEKVNSIQEYMSHSVKFQLNANHVPVLTMEYLVTNQDGKSVYVKESLKEAISSSELSQEILKELKWNCDVSYVGELISTIDNESEKSYQDSLRDMYYSDNDEAKKNTIFKVSIMATSQEECDTIAKLVDENIQKSIQSLNIYGQSTIAQVGTNYEETVCQNLFSDQQTKISNLASIQSSITALKNSLTVNQQEYYEALIDEGTRDEDDTKEEVQNPSLTIQYINKKYIVLGGLLGIFLCVCFWTAKYCFGKCIHTSKDATMDCKIPMIGEVHMKSADTKRLGWRIDRRLTKIFITGKNNETYEQRIELMASDLKVRIEKQKLNVLYLTSSSVSENIVQLQKDVSSALQSKLPKLEVVLGSKLVYDSNAIEMLSKSEATVLFEETEHTYRNDIYKIKELCDKYEVKVLGTIVID